jgi:hypothetical protein
VELAEVMTDNCPKVGRILQLYQIEGEDWHNEDDEEDPENLNPNSGPAGSKKRKKTAVINQLEKAKKKKD